MHEDIAWLREQVEQHVSLDPNNTSGDLNEGYIDALLEATAMLFELYDSKV